MDPDNRLLSNMCAGEEDALSEVIDRYTAYVFTIVWSIVRSRLTRDDAEDIASDVFFTLWQNADRVRPGKLKAYLGTLARRKALNAIRRHREDIALEEDSLPLPALGPEDGVLRDEEYAALRRMLEDLPEPDCSIFILHYFYYQTTGEIAEGLGLGTAAVQKKLQRGRKKLRDGLVKGGYCDE